MSSMRHVVLLALSIALAGSCAAQNPEPDDYYGPYARPSFSASGELEAHTSASGDGLFVRDHWTGEDRPIEVAKPLHCQDCIINELALSADGRTVVFNARRFVTSEGKIYCIHTDGSGLTQIAPANPALRKPLYSLDIGNLAFSPDGDSVLAEVSISPITGPDESETWVGLLNPTVEKQNPALIAQGTPLFWSKDGVAFYFRDVQRTGTVYRWDLGSNGAAIVPGFEHTRILGHIAGTDDVFTLRRIDEKHSEVSVMALDGSEVTASIAARVKQIPAQDADGRYLDSVETTPIEWRFYYYGLIGQSALPHLKTVKMNVKE